LRPFHLISAAFEKNNKKGEKNFIYALHYAHYTLETNKKLATLDKWGTLELEGEQSEERSKKRGTFE
jgi:hypothetical protein